VTVIEELINEAGQIREVLGGTVEQATRTVTQVEEAHTALTEVLRSTQEQGVAAAGLVTRLEETIDQVAGILGGDATALLDIARMQSETLQQRLEAVSAAVEQAAGVLSSAEAELRALTDEDLGAVSVAEQVIEHLQAAGSQ
jgi:ABC-type transporter Mla subunit MlaD